MSQIANRWAKAFRLMLKQRASFGKDSVKLIGQDHLGNKYYEANKPNNIRPIQRYFNSSKNYDDVVDVAHVPPAWDAWLRFRRQEPPSEEELKESEEYYQMQQGMAAQKKVEEEGRQVQQQQYEYRQHKSDTKKKVEKSRTSI